jgi:hypothetical protein
MENNRLVENNRLRVNHRHRYRNWHDGSLHLLGLVHTVHTDHWHWHWHRETDMLDWHWDRDDHVSNWHIDRHWDWHWDTSDLNMWLDDHTVCRTALRDSGAHSGRLHGEMRGFYSLAGDAHLTWDDCPVGGALQQTLVYGVGGAEVDHLRSTRGLHGLGFGLLLHRDLLLLIFVLGIEDYFLRDLLLDCRLGCPVL